MILAITLCGPLVTTSCSSDKEDTEIPPALKQAPAQKQMVSMLQNLGLIATTSTTRATSVVQKGDLTEMRYYDPAQDADISMILDEKASTLNQMVLYSSATARFDNYVDYYRYTVTSSENALIIKNEHKLYDSYPLHATYEFMPNSDNSVTQREIMKDGSKLFVYKYSSDTAQTLKRTDDGGNVDILKNIAVVLK
jgi:hypothetical protein